MSTVTVRTGDQLYVQHIESTGHRWMADEPERLGGADKGPSPYQLLLSSLGACTTITTQMYARRKGWPLESMEVELEHQRVHARDCDECESAEGFIGRIDIKISFVGDLSDEQKGRLFEISGKCPVKRTLLGEILIKPQLAT